MEAYLEEQYDVFEDENYLTQESDIVQYFTDSGREFFDCGQGYYQDEAELICKVSDKFYKVKIEASIVGEKRDVGDKLYFVDEIKSVTYEEIEKPEPKEKVSVTYQLELTEQQKSALENFMRQHYIEY
ncbi:hypothetical protein A616_16500 [Brevibacillus brevis X23]|nr:hypothetical protein A616_16500 [Brevibacillus brevis X23]